MKTGRNYKFWFCTGSQDLYGDECLRKVAEHSRIIVEELNKSGVLPFELVWKPTLITNELIRKTFNEANFLTGKIMDSWSERIQKTALPSSYTV